MQAVASCLDVKVTYPVETGWGTFTADLQSHKFDMLCDGDWVNPKIAKFALYSRPLHFESLYVIARANDRRFDKDLSAVNDDKIKLVSLEGDNPVYIAKSDFPKTKVTEFPDMTDLSQTLVEVETGKADVTIVDKYTFGTYNDHNPGKLKMVGKPIRIYPTSFVFLPEDYQLRDAVNAALDELILDGTMARLNKKYEKYPGAFMDAEVPMQK
jgi:ABC-type amino acid transport substrate-binding protein